MATLGTGTTITYQSGFLAEITDVSLSGWSRESIRTSHMGTTTAHTFLPGTLQDPGTITVTIQWDPESAPDVPMGAAEETVTITFPDAAPASTLAVQAFATGFDITVPFEERIEATVTLKASGAFTHG